MRSPSGLESEVAVKILRADLALDGDAVRRLRDEGRLLARLDHPAILKVHDLVLLDGRIALVTELVEGADLCACWGPAGLGPRGQLQAVAGVAAALAVAHDATDDAGRPLGLVHRDVKPTNIRLGRHGQVKLLDFGIAWSQAEDREARTKSDLVIGSLHYMAPERFLERRARPAWDVWALGATLYEGIVGERFIPRGSHREMSGMALDPARFGRHLADRLRAVPRDLPRDLVDLLDDMLRFDPEGRPSTRDLVARFEEVGDRIGGASMARWCRAGAWPAPQETDGPLGGRTLQDHSLPPTRTEETTWVPGAQAPTAPIVVQEEVTTAVRRPPRRWMALVAGVGVVVAAVLALVASAVTAWIALR